MVVQTVIAMVIAMVKAYARQIDRTGLIPHISLMSLASAYDQLRAHERAFVDGYVADMERDAQRTGERISNVVRQAIPADVRMASRGLLDLPLVQAAIVERAGEVAARHELSPHRLINTVMNVAFSNIEDYITIGEDGVPRFDLANCSRDQMEAIDSIDVEMDPRNPFIPRKWKIKLHSKMDAVAKLGDI